MGINYQGLTDDYMMRYQSRYSNPSYSNYATRQATSSVQANGQYASGIQDAGFGTNTCTDGKDDGKIGLGSALLNAGEGILKGAWNGLTGLLGFGKDENGKTTWNPFKLLGSVAVAAVCVAFPVAGMAACAIGAVAGGAQVIKGAVAASNATTDAEAKAAWENMGEGGATVVGCVLGAKASYGAMKGSSTAAVDDALKTLDNGDDVVKALKGVDKGNIDDVTAALNKAGIKNVDDVNNVIGKFGADTSALGNLDDSLSGMEKVTKTAKAFGKDALSSTKNNGNALLAKAKAGYEAIDEYTTKKTAAKKAQKDLASAEDAFKKGIDSPEDELEALKISRDLAQQDADAAQQALEKTKIGKFEQNRNAGRAKVDTAKTDLATAQQTYDDALKAAKKQTKGLKGEARTEKIAELTKTQQDALTAAQANYKKVKLENSTFGNLTSSTRKNSSTYQYLTQNETTSVIKNIKNINPLKVASNLGADGMKVYNFLKDGNNLSAAIKEFGYTDSMQVVQTLYALGQMDHTA